LPTQIPYCKEVISKVKHNNTFKGTCRKLGNLVLTPKRNKLTDARFEKLLLMHYNKKFVEL